MFGCQGRLSPDLYIDASLAGAALTVEIFVNIRKHFAHIVLTAGTDQVHRLALLVCCSHSGVVFKNSSTVPD